LRILKLATLLFLGGATAVGCGSSATSSAEQNGAKSAGASPGGSFAVLAILDLSGPSKPYAVVVRRGLDAAAAYLNTRGGIDGKRVVVTSLDDGGSAASAVSDLDNYLSAHSKPNLVYPGSESDEVGALLPVLARDKILAIADADPGNELSARASARFPEQFAEASSTFAPDVNAARWFKEHGYTKIGIAEEQIDYAVGETPTMVQALNQYGISHSVASFSASATDVTPEISALKSSGAQAIFLEGVGPAVGYALASRAKLGWSIPVVGDNAASALDPTTLAPESELHDVYLATFRPNSTMSSNTEGVHLLLHAGLPQGSLLNVMGDGWDPVILAATAARQSGSLDSLTLANALTHLAPRSATNPLFVMFGKYGFTANDHDVVTYTSTDNPIVVAGPVRNGQFQTQTERLG